MIYDILNVHVNERGESFYNPFLENVVLSLIEKGFNMFYNIYFCAYPLPQVLTCSFTIRLLFIGIAVDSQGATCIFVEGFNNPDGSPLPLIIRKSDGGYLYATTDLAALQHRIEAEKGERILYVTDSGQEQHFNMVFAAAKLANMIPEHVELVHVPFGVVQVSISIQTND